MHRLMVVVRAGDASHGHAISWRQRRPLPHSTSDAAGPPSAAPAAHRRGGWGRCFLLHPFVVAGVPQATAVKPACRGNGGTRCNAMEVVRVLGKGMRSTSGVGGCCVMQAGVWRGGREGGGGKRECGCCMWQAHAAIRQGGTCHVGSAPPPDLARLAGFETAPHDPIGWPGGMQPPHMLPSLPPSPPRCCQVRGPVNHATRSC